MKRATEKSRLRGVEILSLLAIFTIVAGSLAARTRRPPPGADQDVEAALIQDPGDGPWRQYGRPAEAGFDAAAFVGASDRGTLEVGRRADAVLLDANPLEDVVHTSRIAGVVIAGRWLAAAALTRMLRDLGPGCRPSSRE
ncbi:MAG: hypothetical protein GEU99_21825 [Luteitalea sp.]|nr:hypothetical protein [Luteitalea sp.]